MTEIIIKVEYCDRCPNAEISKVYTADSFEDVRKNILQRSTKDCLW